MFERILFSSGISLKPAPLLPVTLNKPLTLSLDKVILSSKLSKYRIHTVAQMTGLSPALIRAWESRYSLVVPARTPAGYRLYSDEDIANHMVFLMLAAHDTTASAATMAAYHLANNPDIQDQLAADVLATPRPIGYDTMFRTLPLMAGVFHETIRMHPPVAMLLRRTVNACTIDDVQVPADTMVCVPVAFLQRHPDFWSNPNTFDPSRFDEGREEHKRHPFMWMPFGGGAHKCIGLHFARLLFTSLYAELLSQYRIEFQKPNYFPTKVQNLPFAKPTDGLPIRLVPR